MNRVTERLRKKIRELLINTEAKSLKNWDHPNSNEAELLRYILDLFGHCEAEEAEEVRQRVVRLRACKAPQND